MVTTYKKILIINSFQEAISKMELSGDDYVVVSKLNKLVKKLAPITEQFQELVEDARLDHCYKDGTKIVRENGQLQWTAEGEKAFRKAYKELLEKEVSVEVSPISYSDVYAILPKAAQSSNKWEEVQESLSPFFVE
jgi:hypothetical protein